MAAAGIGHAERGEQQCQSRDERSAPVESHYDVSPFEKTMTGADLFDAKYGRRY
jgi:hypothetical protein